eukprot:TRINITY_DN1293_c0_g1_i11.p1 TRINITY_DN1293_c0_g1~~TRINITY_DN1293_c0_g1_i11.p1  ORF type:complete len:273 (+),score=33.60 TRINITY_DN1293_c0_g1_i11:69-821(+)
MALPQSISVIEGLSEITSFEIPSALEARKDGTTSNATSDLKERGIPNVAACRTTAAGAVLRGVLDVYRPAQAKVTNGCTHVVGAFFRARASVASDIHEAVTSGIAAITRTTKSIRTSVAPAMTLDVVLERVDGTFSQLYVNARDGALQLQTNAISTTLCVAACISGRLGRGRETLQPIETRVKEGYLFTSETLSSTFVRFKACVIDVHDMVMGKDFKIHGAEVASKVSACKNSVQELAVSFATYVTRKQT